MLLPLAAERWKTMNADEKKQWIEAFEAEKCAYAEFAATSEGQKAIAEKKSKELEKTTAALAKHGKAFSKNYAKLAKLAEREKNELLDKRRAVPAYFLWFGVHWEQLQTQLGTVDPATVSKKGCEVWMHMKDAKRKRWEDAAEAQDDAYEKYVNRKESMAKMRKAKAGA